MSTPRPVRRVTVVALLVSLAVAPVAGASVAGAGTGAVVGPDTTDADAASTTGSDDGWTVRPQVTLGPLRQQDVDTDSVRMRIALSPNGTATWTVQYWTRLDDENTTAAFESLRADIESNPGAYVDRFATRIRATVRTAENATGREMAARDFAVSAGTRAPPEYGVVSYTFRWVGFAAVDGDAVRAGDAIEGLFLDSRTRLVVAWPADYAATRVAPTPDEERPDAVVWRGAETSFVPGEPRVTVRPEAAVATTGGGDGGGRSGGDGDGSGGDGATGLPLLPLAVVLLVLAVGGGVAWTRRDRGDRSAGATPDPGATGAGGEEGGDGDGADAADTADTDAGPDDPPEELLSNEERVLRFVREKGGRVKQQEIVSAFDWTAARTSQIVRDLRDEGELEGFRLGRENVLKLPDDDASGSAGGATEGAGGDAGDDGDGGT